MNQVRYEVAAAPDRIEFSDGVVAQGLDTGIIDTIIETSHETAFRPVPPLELHKAISVHPPLDKTAVEAIRRFCTDAPLGNMHDGIEFISS